MQSGPEPDTDDSDAHTVECQCDECIDGTIIELYEERQAS